MKAHPEAFLASILDIVGSLIVVLDTEGRIVLFNKACETATGYSADEVFGKVIWDLLLVPEEVEPVKAVFHELRAGTFPNRFENYWLARDGARHRIAWSNTSLVGANGGVEYIIGTGIDVTGEREAQDRARAAEHLASVATMAAGIVHEIKNPLNAAGLQLELLIRRLSAKPLDDTAARAAARLVSDEIQRVGRLLDEFLQFARPRAPTRASGDLRRLAEEVVDYCRPQGLVNDVGLVLDATKDVPVLVDHEQIRQVVLNLVLNAIQAAPKGTLVKVAVSADGGAGLLTIEDTGPGLPAPPDKIFEPFFTTKPGGTGLGLAIARRIVSSHGGEIRVESLPGRTVFTVHLPLPRADGS